MTKKTAARLERDRQTKIKASRVMERIAQGRVPFDRENTTEAAASAAVEGAIALHRAEALARYGWLAEPDRPIPGSLRSTKES